MRNNVVGIAAVSFVMLVAVIYAFIKVGSPLDARAKQFDQTRVSNLSSLKTTIDSYAYSHHVLPTTLSDLSNSDLTTNLKDPESNKLYDYKVTGQDTYELCATFSTSSPSNGSTLLYYDPTFKHPKGYYCFNLSNSSVTIPITPTYNQTLPATTPDPDMDYSPDGIRKTIIRTDMGRFGTFDTYFKSNGHYPATGDVTSSGTIIFLGTKQSFNTASDKSLHIPNIAQNTSCQHRETGGPGVAHICYVGSGQNMPQGYAIDVELESSDTPYCITGGAYTVKNCP